MLFFQQGLLAGDFAIKAGESDGEGLYGTQRISVVQSKSVICHSAKLHHNVIRWNITEENITWSTVCKTNARVFYSKHSDLRSLLWTIWKFLMDACVTLPLKFKTCDAVSSFHTGVLLRSSIRFSMFLFWCFARRPSLSWQDETQLPVCPFLQRSVIVGNARFTYTPWSYRHPLAVFSHAWNNDNHSPRTFHAQNICFLESHHHEISLGLCPKND